jgi:hypothetical protein
MEVSGVEMIKLHTALIKYDVTVMLVIHPIIKEDRISKCVLLILHLKLPGGKVAPCNVEVKNVYSYASTHPIYFRAVLN